MPSLRRESIAVVYGTRPEIIKLAPVVSRLRDAVRLIHTGQHFDAELSDDIAGDMELPSSSAQVDIGGQSRAQQIARGVMGLEPELEGADAVVVQGDTNSSLAGALTANAMDLPLFHVEAGLRSFDRRMPEEHNRVLTDHLADMCWAPTDGNVKNLLAEGIDSDRIEETGNTIVEALRQVLPDEDERQRRKEDLGIDEKRFVLATLHRPENVDDLARLEEILEVLATISVPVVLPLHPRTKARVSEGRLESLLERLVVRPSMGYKDFLSLLAECTLAISDSGGIQEEVSVLKKPLLVVRRSTERPEVLGTFASLLSDPAEVLSESRRALEDAGTIHRRLQALDSPFGDGNAADRMVESLFTYLDSR